MNKKELIFAQYQLFVNTAEKNSDRRQISNGFFLTLNSSLLTFFVFAAKQGGMWMLVISLVGILDCIFWRRMIKSYCQLSTGKFQVIHQIEEHLPIQLFKDEWNYLEKGIGKKYKKITVIEKYIPLTFIGLYLFLGVLISMLF